MAKKVSDSDRLVIAWNKRGKARRFFVWHKDFPKIGIKSRMPINPEDLEERLTWVVDKLDKLHGGKLK